MSNVTFVAEWMNTVNTVTSDILIVVVVKITAFWYVMSCSLIKIFHCYRPSE